MSEFGVDCLKTIRRNRERTRRPPKGRYGKAAQKKAQGYLRHPHHKHKSFDELRTWQQAAYLARYVGQEHGCLTDWELMFCWSIAGQRGPLSEWQFKKLRQILEKILEYID